jgi:macrolide-specific efflux system membrane fusion protein
MIWATVRFLSPKALSPAHEANLYAVAHIVDIEDTVLAMGTIQPLKLVSVGAQASGRIVAMHVALGDNVARGQIIAEIDRSTQYNALEIAEAGLLQVRAQRSSRVVALKQAAQALKRAATTYAQEASSLADYESADATYNIGRADVAALDAQIHQALIAVDTARVNLAYTRVIAPIDGTVVAVIAAEGQTVNAAQATPAIVKLAELQTMTVKVQISEADVTRVRPGQKVYFSILSAPERRYEAKMRAVEPAPESIATDPTTSASSSNSASISAVYYNGLFEIANADQQLRPSMTAQVNIVLQEADHVLGIPASALGEVLTDGRRAVTVVDVRGRVESRFITVGLNNRVTAQVLGGLAEGERVILIDSKVGAAVTR